MQYPLGNPLVPYGTPLHSTELFLQLLKLVFADLPTDYPFRYVPDDYEKSGIAFDVALNKEGEIYGKKPLVVVSRGMQNATPVAVGDLASANVMRHFQHGSNLLTASMIFQVVSRTKAEVEIIAQHIFGLLLMCRTHMPKLLNIHMVTNILLSDVTRMEDDDAMFIARGEFTYAMQYLWTQHTDDPVLQSIGMSIAKITE